MLCIQRHAPALTAAVVLFAATLAVTEQQCAAQSAGGGGETNPKVEAVFPVPPVQDLSTITRPSLRTELLDMVHNDQVARKSGK